MKLKQGQYENLITDGLQQLMQDSSADGLVERVKIDKHLNIG